MNLFLSAVGLYSESTTTAGFLTTRLVDPKQPYFYQACFTIGVVNLAFIAMVCLTALDLLRLRVQSVKVYMWTVVALICYDFVNGGLWLLPRGVGMSIAGATGVGNMGIAPFQFALFFIPWGYPILSVAGLYVARRKLTIKC